MLPLLQLIWLVSPHNAIAYVVLEIVFSFLRYLPFPNIDVFACRSYVNSFLSYKMHMLCCKNLLYTEVLS